MTWRALEDEADYIALLLKRTQRSISAIDIPKMRKLTNAAVSVLIRVSIPKSIRISLGHTIDIVFFARIASRSITTIPMSSFLNAHWILRGDIPIAMDHRFGAAVAPPIPDIAQ